MEGFKLARKIVLTSVFNDIRYFTAFVKRRSANLVFFRPKERVDPELSKRYDAVGDEYMASFIKKHVTSASNPCGTCRWVKLPFAHPFLTCILVRMGEEPATSVVNSRLQVREVEGLRVVDAR